MANTKLNGILRVFPSLTDIAFLMPIIFLFGRLDGAKTLLGDGDTGWHIRAGQWMLVNGRVPDKDLFSFTKPDAPWFAWEWLWDVTFGWLHLHWGMEAVLIASTFLLCITFALLFRLVLRQCGNPVIAIVVTILATAASSIHWLARPHLLTLLFSVLFLSILERVREGRTVALYWLPLLTVLWTNLHGGFFVGIVIVCTYGLGETISSLLSASAVSLTGAIRKAAPYWASATACLAASLVNPYTWHLHDHVLRYLADPFLYAHVGEFQGPTFQMPGAGFFETLLILGVAASVWHIQQRQFIYPLLSLGWAHLALFALRNVPLYAILVAPVIATAAAQVAARLAEHSALQKMVKNFASGVQKIGQELGEMEAVQRLHLVSLTAIVLLGFALYRVQGVPKLKAEYDPQKYPAALLDVLREGGREQRLFTHDEWGDYLIYQLYPQMKVYVDGRSDFYGATFDQDFLLDIVNVKYDWQQRLDKQAINTVLMPPDSALAAVLKQSPRWNIVHDDGQFALFRAVRGNGPGDLSVDTHRGTAATGESRQTSTVILGSLHQPLRSVPK